VFAGRATRSPTSAARRQRLVKRAGVKDFRLDDLRHTTASRLLRETGT